MNDIGWEDAVGVECCTGTKLVVVLDEDSESWRSEKCIDIPLYAIWCDTGSEMVVGIVRDEKGCPGGR